MPDGHDLTPRAPGWAPPRTDLARVDGYGLDGLREKWPPLGPQASPFGTWEWVRLWWEHFGDERCRLVLWALRDEDERLAVVVPLYRRRVAGIRLLRFLGHGPSDQLGPITAPTHEAAAAPVLRSALRLTGGWDLFVGEQLPGLDWGPTLDATVVRVENSPVLDVTGRTWDDYLAGRSANFRQQVRRRARRLADGHQVEFRLTETAEQLDQDFSALLRLHEARWRGQTSFTRAQQFHREFARTALARGWLRLWTLSLDGRPTAAWYGFRVAGHEWYYQAGRDPRLDSLHVGFVLLSHTVREAMNDGVHTYRFLRGREEYKLRFGARDPGLETVAAPRGPVGRVAMLAKGATRLLPSGVRRRVTSRLASDDG